MLYVLPPPTGPTPSSWPAIICRSSRNNAKGRRHEKEPRDPWNAVASAVGPSAKRPPRSQSLRLKPRKKESGAGASTDEEDGNRNKSLSECYFAGKGAALVLPQNERVRPGRRLSSSGSDIQQHLQSMFYLLRPEETLKMAVKLESVHPSRTRYLVVVSCMGRQEAEECCLLGIDCNERTTVGLVLRVLADTAITLDGDGGFSVSVCGRQHIFKPVSVQAMWSALQTIHKVSSKAREQNYFLGGLTHDWVSYYEQRIESDRSCLNEWHAMDSIESRRPPSPDSVRTKPRQREETETVIRCTLKEIMMSVDLDEVTSKHIRGRLEEYLDMDLGEFKPFIDEEMLTILGQMDAATEIFDHVYLGSEWNASNHEELQKNGVRHILNVTREIDNFFPGMFNYLNIRVYDDEKTDLLKHWDDTFKYISRARAEGSKVLVHCKMGVSRSASVVIAYAMKAYNWDFKKAYEYVKTKRNCIKPNCSFMSQLETYQGILDAMKNREKLQRSKSETNLKSPSLAPKEAPGEICQRQETRSEKASRSLLSADWTETSGSELGRVGGRPKSWSPDNSVASILFAEEAPAPTSLSMEYLNSEERTDPSLQSAHPGAAETCPNCRTRMAQDELPCKECFKVTTGTGRETMYRNSHLRIPCENGQTYSVSQNRIAHLPGSANDESDFVAYVRNRVIEFESQSGTPNAEAGAPGKKSQSDRKGLVLNLTSQFETSRSKSGSPTESERNADVADAKVKNSQIVNSILVREEVWDPGERRGEFQTSCGQARTSAFEPPDGEKELPCSERCAKREGDPFSDKLDRVFDREDRRRGTDAASASTEVHAADGPSRQNSWSSHDSAVVLGYQGETREAPSRQSSWGSGDLRGPPGALPSRNSSWGSYDLRPAMQFVIEKAENGEEDIVATSNVHWNPGTVRRTKQKLEEVIQVKEAKDAAPEDEESSPPPPPPPPILKTEISMCSLKLHGPKPYQSPVPAKDLRIPASQIAEAINPVLVHYASTPALSVRASLENASIWTDKMTVSHPDITFLQERFGRGTEQEREEEEEEEEDEADHDQDEDEDDRNLPSLSASAPGCYSATHPCNDQAGSQSHPLVDTTQFSSVRHQKQVLENLTNKCCVLPKRCTSMDESVMITTDSPKTETEAQKSVSGMVQNLKKEFEAKSASKATPSEINTENSRQSPAETLLPPIGSSEDLSVKNLVGKYEIKKNKHRENESNKKWQSSMPGSNKKAKAEAAGQAQLRVKHSSLFLHNLKNSSSGEKVLVLDRPSAKGPSPSVVVASVVAKAATKKQQGKTHPLAHLTINPRHTNPVYNTM